MIPFRWKLRWFLQGMASVFGGGPSAEQRLREARQCVDEMIGKPKDTLMKYEYWQADTTSRLWYWHIRARNGEVVAQGQGYKRKRDLLHAIKLVQSSSDAEIALVKAPRWERTPP